MSAFLSKEDQNRIVKAIEEAELNTSGEVRVHLESKCKGDAVQRAVFVFNFLKMYKTRREKRSLDLLGVQKQEIRNHRRHRHKREGSGGVLEQNKGNIWARPFQKAPLPMESVML